MPNANRVLLTLVAVPRLSVLPLCPSPRKSTSHTSHSVVSQEAVWRPLPQVWRCSWKCRLPLPPSCSRRMLMWYFTLRYSQLVLFPFFLCFVSGDCHLLSACCFPSLSRRMSFPQQSHCEFVALIYIRAILYLSLPLLSFVLCVPLSFSLMRT